MTAPKTNINPTSPSNPTDQAQASSNHTLADSNPHGVFVYGTLMAEKFLAWLLTGSSENHAEILSLRQAAVLQHYRRVPVKQADYPALIAGSASDRVEGFLITPASASQWKTIDDFEGEVYQRQRVQVCLKGSAEMRAADVYVWVGDLDKLLLDQEWDFAYFEENRLEDWLDLFDGMEMVG